VVLRRRGLQAQALPQVLALLQVRALPQVRALLPPEQVRALPQQAWLPERGFGPRPTRKLRALAKTNTEPHATFEQAS
jgi:hypothetical protein